LKNYMYIYVRTRARARVCVCACVCAYMRMSAYICVWMYDKKRKETVYSQCSEWWIFTKIHFKIIWWKYSQT